MRYVEATANNVNSYKLCEDTMQTAEDYGVDLQYKFYTADRATVWLEGSEAEVLALLDYMCVKEYDVTEI